MNKKNVKTNQNKDKPIKTKKRKAEDAMEVSFGSFFQFEIAAKYHAVHFFHLFLMLFERSYLFCLSIQCLKLNYNALNKKRKKCKVYRRNKIRRRRGEDKKKKRKKITARTTNVYASTATQHQRTHSRKSVCVYLCVCVCVCVDAFVISSMCLFT